VSSDPEVSAWRQQRPAERGRAVSSSAGSKIAGIVDDLVRRAGGEGERAVAWTRLFAACLALIAWLPTVWNRFLAGDETIAWMALLIVVMAAFSAATLVILRRRGATWRLLVASIVVDALLMLSIIAVPVIRPAGAYEGVLHLATVGMIYLGLVAAGVRLSRRGAAVATVLFGGGLLALYFVDEARNPELARHDAPHIAAVFAITCCSAIFGFFIAARTRKLVLDAANQAVLADRARSRLGTYVSEDIAREAMSTDEVRITGRRSDVAVIFTDLRGFTTWAEGLPPEELFRQLNGYLEAMVSALKPHDAYVDKFIGDSIMAVFGAPTTKGDEATRALAAVAALDDALGRLNRDRARLSLPPLQHGVGAHYGPAIQGNVGTSHRASYTVVGDTVNVAARLEGATKELGARALLSQELLDAARREGADPRVVERGAIQVKGRARPVVVYSPIEGGAP
jgi:class 3 adenylate cyclase